MFKDNLFNKIEKKTNINKDTIINLANKLQSNNMKDENTLREVIKDLEDMAANKREEDAYWKGYVKKQAEAVEICKMCKYRKDYINKQREKQAKNEV